MSTTNKITSKGKAVAKKTGEYASKNPKTVLYVLLGIGVVYAGYKIVSAISNPGDQNLDLQVGGTGGTTSNATVTNQLAKNYAQQLLDAMNAKYPVYGTDNDTIEAVFDKLKNGDDFIKVYNAFGTKDYNGYNSPPEGAWSWLDSYEKRNLVYWLKSELSSTFERTLYNKVKLRLESAGFTF